MLRYLLLAGLTLASFVLPTMGQSPGEEVPAPGDTPSAAPVGEASPPRPPLDMSGIGGMIGLGGGMGGSMLPGGTYRTTWLPSQGVSGQSAKLGVVQQDLSASYPLWMSSDGDTISARAHVRSEHFDTDAVLPDSHRAFPTDLWNVSLGLNGMYRFDNGWTAGGTVNFGSASDHPFANIIRSRSAS